MKRTNLFHPLTNTWTEAGELAPSQCLKTTAGSPLVETTPTKDAAAGPRRVSTLVLFVGSVMISYHSCRYSP